MIFVATGTQFPFDRLIQYMDEWAGHHEEEVVAQLGEGEYAPTHMRWERFMGIDAYNDAIRQSSVFISHAGMGNIISAREQGVPIIVLNRRAELGEHRNDHQADGLGWMGELDGVYTASTKEELFALLAQSDTLQAASDTREDRLQHLVEYLHSVVS